jgi:hypothetical protein
MTMFEDVHADRIVGTLTTFDRMIFKGHLTRLYGPGAISAMLWRLGFPLTEFTQYATAATEELTANAKAVAAEAGRPYLYSDRSRRRGGDLTKEDTARAIADRDGITDGVVCVFSVVEPCWSFQVRADHRTHRLEAIRRERKCVHHYVYLIDPEFGFMHVRVQAWIPYEIQIYINGREWLARQLDAAGVGYRRYDNALLSVEDLEVADTLCEKLAHRSWPRLLNAFARRVNPLLAKITAAGFGGYYWVLDQAEIATDVMFQTRPQLLAIWPDLVRHASVNLSSTDVLRFLGRKLHPALRAEVLTEAKRRPEGWRIKHRLARNWVKVYDKASVLRVETTINNPREFRVLRLLKDDDGRRSRRWCECERAWPTRGATSKSGPAPTAATSTPSPAPHPTAKASPPSTPCADPEPTMAATSHGSSPSTGPISPCSGPCSQASTPSPGSATTTSRHGSTPERPTASKKPTVAANECPASSSSCAATASSPKSHGPGSTASPLTATGYSTPPSPCTTTTSRPPISKQPDHQ